MFVGMAVLSALIAVPAGHVGRFRGRRLDGEGAGRRSSASWSAGCCCSCAPWPCSP
ncbi:hypothetical protein ACFQ0Q_41565 [Streptomyces aureus]